MSDKPLVKILSRDRVEFLGVIYIRSELERFAEKPKYSSEVLYHLGAKEVLRQMDEFEEQPKPKWELGTVLKGCSEIYRLDTFVSMGDDKQSEIWDFTDMRTGESLSGGAFPYKLYVIHRLPHEFKVGDWFSCEGEDGIFQCNGVLEDGFLICVGDFMQYKAEYCRHVPPPKKETAQSNQGNEAGTIFNYSRVKFGKFSDRQDESNLKKGWLSEVLTDAREKVNARPDWQKNRVKSSEEPKEEKLRRGWLDRQFTKVEQEVSEWPERMKVEAGFTPKPEKSFRGVHWDSVGNGGFWEHSMLARCICDLRDELRRLKAYP